MPSTKSPKISPVSTPAPVASPTLQPARSPLPSTPSPALLDVSTTLSPKKQFQLQRITKCENSEKSLCLRPFDCFPTLNCYQHLYGCYFHHHHHHHHHHHDYHHYHHYHHHHLNGGQPSTASSTNSESGSDNDANTRGLISENDYYLPINENQKILPPTIPPKEAFAELPIQPPAGYCGSPFLEFLITSENCQVRHLK